MKTTTETAPLLSLTAPEVFAKLRPGQKPASRTEALCFALGWQGGTITQVAEATGCDAYQLVNSEPEQTVGLNCDHSLGWSAARTCSIDFNLRVNFPPMAGNLDFWLGVAKGIQFGA